MLQPVRSFKIRGAGNAILQATRRGARRTACSRRARATWRRASRTRRACAACPRRSSCPSTRRRRRSPRSSGYGGRVIKVPYDEWWQVLVTGRYEGVDGLFVHPVDDERVMAGNGTIGLELLEQLDDFDTVVVPYGGGGLVTGIASAVKATRPGGAVLRRPSRRRARRWPRRSQRATPTAVEYTPSFVDGSGSRELIPRVWAHASRAARRRVRDAARRGRPPRSALIAERMRVIAEGAGALAPAAALAAGSPARRRSSASSPAATSTRPCSPDPRTESTVNVDAVRARASRRCRTASRSSTHRAARRCPTRSARRSPTRCARRRATSARRTRRAARSRRSSSGAKDDAGAVPRLHRRRDLVRDEHDDARLRALARRRPRLRARATRSLTTQLDHDGGVAPWVELAADKGLDGARRAGDGRADGRLRRPRAAARRPARGSSRSRSPRTRPARSPTRSASARSRATPGRSRGSTPCTTRRTSRSTSRSSAATCCCARRTSSAARISASPTSARELAETLAPVQGAAVGVDAGRPAVRDGHAAVRAARRLQRDDRLPRLDRRHGGDPRLRARARRASSSRACRRT